jgi:hypothetical protein
MLNTVTKSYCSESYHEAIGKHIIIEMTSNQTLETENRAAAKRTRRASLSPKQRAAANAERQRYSRANYSSQQRATENAADAERHRSSRAIESHEQRVARGCCKKCKAQRVKSQDWQEKHLNREH